MVSYTIRVQISLYGPFCDLSCGDVSICVLSMTLVWSDVSLVLINTYIHTMPDVSG